MKGLAHADLEAVAEIQWPTPRTITGGAESAERKQELGRTESGGGDLQAAVGEWQTPKSGSGNASRGGDRKDELLLAGQAREFGHQDQPTTQRGPKCLRTGRTSDRLLVRPRLNPCFVEALMGFAVGWTMTAPTAFGVSETQLSQHRQQKLFGD